jgi:hypothetical protein
MGILGMSNLGERQQWRGTFDGDTRMGGGFFARCGMLAKWHSTMLRPYIDPSIFLLNVVMI